MDKLLLSNEKWMSFPITTFLGCVGCFTATKTLTTNSVNIRSCSKGKLEGTLRIGVDDQSFRVRIPFPSSSGVDL